MWSCVYCAMLVFRVLSESVEVWQADLITFVTCTMYIVHPTLYTPDPWSYFHLLSCSYFLKLSREYSLQCYNLCQHKLKTFFTEFAETTRLLLLWPCTSRQPESWRWVRGFSFSYFVSPGDPSNPIQSVHLIYSTTVICWLRFELR